MAEKPCEICGKMFRLRYRGTRQYSPRFCSRACAGVARRMTYRLEFSGVTNRDRYGRTTVERHCAYCGSIFFVTPTKVRDGQGLYCSKTCQYKGNQRSTVDEAWLTLVKTGYVERRWRDPETKKIHAMNEHRYIWEKANGPIPDGYEVHHKDEDKTNNDISNLECIPISKHRSLHSARPQIWRTLPDGTEQKRCSLCGEFKSYAEYSHAGRRPSGGECSDCKNAKDRKLRRERKCSTLANASSQV